MPDEDPSGLVVDLYNQPKRISLDVENREPAHAIRRRNNHAHVIERSPLCFLRNAIPRIQRCIEIAMPLSRVHQHLSAYDVHEAPLTIKFAICEFVKAI